jgi:hypothetical protein
MNEAPPTLPLSRSFARKNLQKTCFTHECFPKGRADSAKVTLFALGSPAKLDLGAGAA